MIKLIHLPTFIISLAIGIFLAYTTLDKKQIIYIYPNQDNYENIQYKDKNGTCLDVRSKKITCNNKIKSHPIYI
tara:strand:+ start:211 stop:432 length:222 start_codon:yes stop_codon:yes gene_type:complete